MHLKILDKRSRSTKVMKIAGVDEINDTKPRVPLNLTWQTVSSETCGVSASEIIKVSLRLALLNVFPLSKIVY